MNELTLAGVDGALHCVLHGDAARAALVLPGRVTAGGRLGGSPARPDLNYTRALLQEAGYSVLEVWWEVGETDDLDAWLLANARAAFAALDEPALLVGRSLGTRALALLRAADPTAAALPSIWIAPLLNRDSVREALQQSNAPTFVLGGAADPSFDRDAVAAHDVVVLEGADHGFDVGDAAASAQALAGALERMRAFVDGL